MVALKVVNGPDQGFNGASIELYGPGGAYHIVPFWPRVIRGGKTRQGWMGMVHQEAQGAHRQGALHGLRNGTEHGVVPEIGTVGALNGIIRAQVAGEVEDGPACLQGPAGLIQAGGLGPGRAGALLWACRGRLAVLVRWVDPPLVMVPDVCAFK